MKSVLPDNSGLVPVQVLPARQKTGQNLIPILLDYILCQNRVWMKLTQTLPKLLRWRVLFKNGLKVNLFVKIRFHLLIQLFPWRKFVIWMGNDCISFVSKNLSLNQVMRRRLTNSFLFKLLFSLLILSQNLYQTGFLLFLLAFQIRLHVLHQPFALNLLNFKV